MPSPGRAQTLRALVSPSLVLGVLAKRRLDRARELDQPLVDRPPVYSTPLRAVELGVELYRHRAGRLDEASTSSADACIGSGVHASRTGSCRGRERQIWTPPESRAVQVVADPAHRLDVVDAIARVPSARCHARFRVKIMSSGKPACCRGVVGAPDTAVRRSSVSAGLSANAYPPAAPYWRHRPPGAGTPPRPLLEIEFTTPCPALT